MNSANQAKIQISQIENWLFKHFQPTLEGPSDGLDDESQLLILSKRFLVSQCKALVFQKVMAEARGVNAEDETITAEALQMAIERDFGRDKDFMALWHPVGTADDWVMNWAEKKPSFVWPSAPNGGKYIVKQVKFV